MVLVVSLAVANLSCFVICCVVWWSCAAATATATATTITMTMTASGLTCVVKFQIEVVEPFLTLAWTGGKAAGDWI
jgi:hypothetical protein